MSSSGGSISSFVGSKWATIAAVAALAGGAALVPVVTGGGDSEPTANLWVENGAGACTRSSSAVSYAASSSPDARCGAIGTAYAASTSSGGDTVCVRPATYSADQTIAFSTRTGTATTIQECGGDSTITSDFDIRGDHVTLKGFDVSGDTSVAGYSAGLGVTNRIFDVTLQDMHMTSGIYLVNAEDVTIEGTEPCDVGTSCSSEICCMHATDADDSKVINLAGQVGGDTATHVTNLTIENTEIHSQTRSGALVHTECAFFIAVDGLVVRGTWWHGCAVFDWAVAQVGGDDCPTTVLMENNVFEASDDLDLEEEEGTYIGYDDPACETEFTIRGNTMEQSIAWQGGGVQTAANRVVTGNVMVQGSGCSADAVMVDNAQARSGGACSGNTTIASITSQVTDQATDDFTLKSGSSARGIVDAGFPTLDLLGCSRGAGPADAGAYQFGGC